MSDARNKVQRKFAPEHRFSNFGEVITRITAQGFRCHRDTLIEINSPITAFCGLNGTGKSTLLQLAATAYRSADRINHPHFNISDFMVVGTLDPSPFTSDASVEYRYWQKDRGFKTTTLSYVPESTRWRGYSNRLERRVFFTGVGHYLPKIEQRDFAVRYARHLHVLSSTPVESTVKDWASIILGYNYDQAVSNTVDYLRSAAHRQAQVVSVERHGVTYSEAHMGYGEGRTLYFISALESLPERSLVLIEEPETSLHPSAQYQLGRYLVDVVNRKSHQIFLTTHSMFLLTSLPSAAIVYLKRTDQGIDPIRDLAPLEVRSLLSDGHVKALHVLVEDDCAQAILREIVLRVDRDFLRVVEIHIGGDSDAIAQTVRALLKTKIPIACVRDADKGPSASENIYSLPGSHPPELELFNHPAVSTYLMETYQLALHDFGTVLSGVDHHIWLDRLAHRVNQDRNTLLGELARVYARGLSETETDNLVRLLKEAARA